jgi:hypothetical protein
MKYDVTLAAEVTWKVYRIQIGRRMSARQLSAENSLINQ